MGVGGTRCLTLDGFRPPADSPFLVPRVTKTGMGTENGNGPTGVVYPPGARPVSQAGQSVRRQPMGSVVRCWAAPYHSLPTHTCVGLPLTTACPHTRVCALWQPGCAQWVWELQPVCLERSGPPVQLDPIPSQPSHTPALKPSLDGSEVWSQDPSPPTHSPPGVTPLSPLVLDAPLAHSPLPLSRRSQSPSEPRPEYVSHLVWRSWTSLQHYSCGGYDSPPSGCRK